MVLTLYLQNCVYSGRHQSIMGSEQSKLQTFVKDAINNFSKIVDDMKVSVTGAVKEFFGSENLKEAFQFLINTIQELNAEDKKAVEQLQKCIEKVLF